jgi:hypothetical protein
MHRLPHKNLHQPVKHRHSSAHTVTPITTYVNIHATLWRRRRQGLQNTGIGPMHRPPDPIYSTSRADVGQERAAAARVDAAPSTPAAADTSSSRCPRIQAACTTTSHAHALGGNQPCTSLHTHGHTGARSATSAADFGPRP